MYNTSNVVKLSFQPTIITCTLTTGIGKQYSLKLNYYQNSEIIYNTTSKDIFDFPSPIITQKSLSYYGSNDTTNLLVMQKTGELIQFSGKNLFALNPNYDVQVFYGPTTNPKQYACIVNENSDATNGNYIVCQTDVRTSLFGISFYFTLKQPGYEITGKKKTFRQIIYSNDPLTFLVSCMSVGIMNLFSMCCFDIHLCR